VTISSSPTGTQMAATKHNPLDSRLRRKQPVAELWKFTSCLDYIGLYHQIPVLVILYSEPGFFLPEPARRPPNGTVHAVRYLWLM